MKVRFLIIDTDREHCEALSASMRAFGYDVRTASSSLAAVEVAETFSPTAIVTDPTADTFNPFALLRALRTQQPHTPIILTARNSSIETALHAIQDEGAYHYFEKPVDLEKFLPVLERAAELAETRRQNEILRRQLRDLVVFRELLV